jgi:hypothetical protein
MLKIGNLLVNEELVQVVSFDPSVNMLSVFLAGQLVTFMGPDVPEAWSVLQAETNFVAVGKTQGNSLVNTDQVGFAFIQGVPPQFTFRIQGRDYPFADPGDFDFSQLEGAAASADAVIWSDVQTAG